MHGLGINKAHTIPFRLFYGIVLVEGSIDHVEGYFAFDTGAEVTVFNKNHIKVSRRSEEQAVIFDEATQDSALGEIDKVSMRLGDIVIEKANTTVMDMNYVEAKMREKDADIRFLGSIGHDLIGNGKIEVDYANERLVFNPVDISDNMIKIPFKKNALPLIDVEVCGRTYCFVLDTGANAFVFHAPDIPEEGVEERFDAEMETTHRIRELSFAGNTYHDLVGVVTDLSAIREKIPEVQGIIGYGLLKDRKCIFDFDNHFLYLMS